MQRFLCWNTKIFSENNGITVCQHKPEKKNLALVCADIWEGVHNGYATVIKVGDTYRLYYRAAGQSGFIFGTGNPEKRTVCIAESTDGGITFKKKNIGKFEYNGSTDNNITFWRDNGNNLDTFTVFYDENPDCPENEKFKALARDSGRDILDLYISADGYDFSYAQRIMLPGIFDSYNTVFWNEDTKQYNLYFRGYHHADGTSAKCYAEVDATNDIRDVRLGVSTDFRNWEFIDFIKFEEGQEYVQLYTNQITRYYREKNTLIGFPVRYVDRVADNENLKHMPLYENRKEIIEKYGRGGTAFTDCAIMTSTDGLTFDLRSKAFMTPGMESTNTWWYGNCYTAYGLYETVADDGETREISFLMGENYRVKNVNFRRYTVRLDGFFSWYGDNDAYAVTKPFTLENGNMFVNFETSVAGGLTVELLDENGKEIEGYKSYTMFGNTTNRPVEFKKPLSELKGKKVKIKFKLNDAHLYSFEFE